MIFRMAAENSTWGAPRIHGELSKLGFDVSERTVSRWVHKARTNPQPAQRWKTFLENHREVIAAMDFFIVPTLTFGVLYCFFVIAHDRRRILHINVTRHPTGFWITQQLREAFRLLADPCSVPACIRPWRSKQRRTSRFPLQPFPHFKLFTLTRFAEVPRLW